VEDVNSACKAEPTSAGQEVLWVTVDGLFAQEIVMDSEFVVPVHQI